SRSSPKINPKTLKLKSRSSRKSRARWRRRKRTIQRFPCPKARKSNRPHSSDRKKSIRRSVKPFRARLAELLAAPELPALSGQALLHPLLVSARHPAVPMLRQRIRERPRAPRAPRAHGPSNARSVVTRSLLHPLTLDPWKAL